MNNPTQGVPGCPLCSSLNRICTLHCIAEAPAQSIDECPSPECETCPERAACTEEEREIAKDDERTAKSEMPATYSKAIAHAKIRMLEEDLAEATEQMAAAQAAVKANHDWHQIYDEHGGYPDSDLCTLNMAAMDGHPSALDTLKAQWQREAKVAAIQDAAKWFAKNRLDRDAYGVLMARAAAIEAGGSDE